MKEETFIYLKIILGIIYFKNNIGYHLFKKQYWVLVFEIIKNR